MESGQRQLHVAVVGAGVNGLSAAWQLLERGHRVTLLEQFPVPHSRGSSHGHSRITRYAYKAAGYTRLMRRAFPLWSQLESLSGQRLFVNCGMAALGSDNFLENMSQVLESNSLPYERLRGDSVAGRFPRLSEFDDCVLDPSAGILLADKCMQALRSRVDQLGGSICESVRVTKVDPLPDGGCVRLSLAGSGMPDAEEHQLTVDSVVLAAGAWAGQLLSGLGLDLPLRPIGVTAMYWRRRQAESGGGGGYGPENFPTFVYVDDEVQVYGLPEFEFPGMVKICYHDGPDVDPDARETAEQRQPFYLPALTDFVRRRFPDLQPEPAVTENCMFTMTPDGGLIVDRHPQHPNILFVCGCSGHGFKLGPVIGQLLAEMATGLPQASEDAAFMSAARFGRQ